MVCILILFASCFFYFLCVCFFNRAKKAAETLAARATEPSTTPSAKPVTRSQKKQDSDGLAARRVDWAEQKRKLRQKWTSQKRRRHREQCLSRYHQKKAKFTGNFFYFFFNNNNNNNNVYFYSAYPPKSSKPFTLLQCCMGWIFTPVIYAHSLTDMTLRFGPYNHVIMYYNTLHNAQFLK